MKTMILTNRAPVFSKEFTIFIVCIHRRLDKQGQINIQELYQQQKDKVYHIALGFMQNTADAEDVMQEVFIEVFRSWASFERRSAISTWIYRITVNRSIDLLRKKKRLRGEGMLYIESGEEGELNLDRAHFDHPGIALENKEKARILFAAIELLPENQRKAFVLFHVEEMSQKEVAQIMDVSPKAVESLIQRAKSALREILGKYYDKTRGK